MAGLTELPPGAITRLTVLLVGLASCGGKTVSECHVDATSGDASHWALSLPAWRGAGALVSAASLPSGGVAVGVTLWANREHVVERCDAPPLEDGLDVVVLDSKGQVRWRRWLEGKTTAVSKIGVDAAGYLYVAQPLGDLATGTGQALRLTRIDPKGDVVAVRELAMTGFNVPVLNWPMSVAPDGTIAMAFNETGIPELGVSQPDPNGGAFEGWLVIASPTLETIEARQPPSAGEPACIAALTWTQEGDLLLSYVAPCLVSSLSEAEGHLVRTSSDGAVIWDVTDPGGSIAATAAGMGIVVGNEVAAIELETGGPLWTQPMPDAGISDVAVVAGAVHAVHAVGATGHGSADSDGWHGAWNASTGERLFEAESNHPDFDTISTVDGDGEALVMASFFLSTLAAPDGLVIEPTGGQESAGGIVVARQPLPAP